MNSQRLDGKEELEKALASRGQLSIDDLVINTNPQCIFNTGLSNNHISIEFDDRDDLLESLCKKVFGAIPRYRKDE